MAEVDLPAAADTLSRAADLIEKQTQGAGGPRGRWRSDHEYVWLGNDDRIDAENEWDADYFATFDPTAVAALAPVLRYAAEIASYIETIGRRPMTGVDGLVEFARRLLREDDAEPNAMTVQAGGRLVDVPGAPLAHGREEET